MRYVKNYEGLYSVTSCGRVYSHKRKKFLKPQNNGNGYLFVTLFKDYETKQMYVHRLVSEAYIPNPNNYEQVNHKDENKENNCLQNLEWCDAKYNTNYGTRNKRAAESRSIKVICVETGEVYCSMNEAGRQTNIHTGSIAHCCNGERKTAGGYHWEYVED